MNLDLKKGHTLTTDPGLFRHILNNLFSNAVEYAPKGGEIVIASLNGTGESPSGLSVRNSVTEMSAEELPHLFERFWRKDPARSGTGHSGPGLSVARTCAETLSMKLEANLDKGQIRFDISTEEVFRSQGETLPEGAPKD